MTKNHDDARKAAFRRRWPQRTAYEMGVWTSHLGHKRIEEWEYVPRYAVEVFDEGAIYVELKDAIDDDDIRMHDIATIHDLDTGRDLRWWVDVVWLDEVPNRRGDLIDEG